MSCCLKPADFGPVNSNQLHHFSNASEAAFGSVSYFKLVSHADRVHCSFLFGKSHVAPLKAILLSHLELSATNASVRQDKTLKKSCRCLFIANPCFGQSQHVSASLCEEQKYALPHVFLPIGLPYYKRAQVQIRGAMWKV